MHSFAATIQIARGLGRGAVMAWQVFAVTGLAAKVHHVEVRVIQRHEHAGRHVQGVLEHGLVHLRQAEMGKAQRCMVKSRWRKAAGASGGGAWRGG